MGKIKKILVPVDGSVNGCKAVDQAIFFAENARLILISFMWRAISIKIFRVISCLTASGRKFLRNSALPKHVETGNIPEGDYPGRRAGA